MNRRALILSIAILVAAAAALLAMGRNPICTCGTIDLWVGTRDSPKTSQMLADWYSLSHIVHGLLFYAALWLVARRWPAEWRFVAALLVEASWEVTENTPMVIDRYRETTAALGYRGGAIGHTPIQPYVFGALNTSGNTSYAAVGLSAKFGNSIYIRPGIGLAIHNGSAADYYRTDKIAFGSRLLFEPEIGVGAR